MRDESESESEGESESAHAAESRDEAAPAPASTQGYAYIAYNDMYVRRFYSSSFVLKAPRHFREHLRDDGRSLFLHSDR